MRSGAVALVSCFTVIVCGAAWAVEPPLARRGIAEDASGNVVLDEAGERHSFGRDVLAARAAASAPRAAFRLAASPAGTSLATEGPYTLDFARTFEFSIWGTSIGRAGMIPVDLDGDGALELVLGASSGGGFSGNDNVLVASFEPTGQGYLVRWATPVFEEGVGRVTVERIGGQPKILIGLGDGTLRVYDGATRTFEREGSVGAAITDILLADADNDGTDELVVATGRSLHLLAPATLAEERRIDQGAADVAVGNVDADPALEVVLVSGSVLEIDGTDVEEEWNFSSLGAGVYLGLADVDGDGMQEIVSARNWYYLDVYDADVRSQKYQVRTDLDVHALTLVDVTGDGRAEILYGDAQWGSVHALDGASGVQLWEVPNPEHGITRIAVADTDGDGARELLWGGGWTSTGADNLFVAGLASRKEEFRTPDVVGPFAALAQGNVDADADDEIVAISWEGDSGYADGVVHVFDAETFRIEWQSGTDLFDRFAWTGVQDAVIGDVDRDGKNEIVVGTDRLYDGRIFVIDARSRAVERTFSFDSGSPISALALADMDGDGAPEIVAGNSVAHSGSPGVYVYWIDGATGAVEWKSPSLAAGFGGVRDLDVGDVTGDGVADVVVAAGRLWIVDGASRALRSTSSDGHRSVRIGVAPGNGRRPIWSGTDNGTLQRIDPDALTVLSTNSVCTGQVNALSVDRAATLSGAIAFACDRNLAIYGIEESAVSWRSGAIGSAIGVGNSLLASDRGERRARLVVGTGRGIAVFEGYGTAARDIDGDGVLNYLDVCPEVGDADQRDTDGDGLGDACNDANDADGDEWSDALDVCPAAADPGQADADADRTGDACNDAADRDGDEWSDALDDCPADANADQADRDGDGEGDVCDRYPDNPDNYAARCDEAVANETALAGELAQCHARRFFADGDGDGEEDSTDACRGTPSGSPVDSAGCSQAEVCAGATRSNLCKRLDWRNDEPVANEPRDCHWQKPWIWLSSGGATPRCVAR